MTSNRPLAGKRILVTRASHQAGRLSAELKKLGAETIEIPAIEILPPASFGPFDTVLREVQRYQWLVVTSANAVDAIRHRMIALNLPVQTFSHLKIAAIGGTTAHALEDAGLFVSVTPKEYVAESLLDALAGQVKGQRVVIVRAAVARDIIPEILVQRGAQVEVVEAYRTAVPRGSAERIAALFAGKPPDAATFTSSSAVINFFHLMSVAGNVQRHETMLAVSIGPVTSETLRQHNWDPVAEADPHDITGLAAAAVRALRGRS